MKLDPHLITNRRKLRTSERIADVRALQLDQQVAPDLDDS
jgi:hypothetical protein